MPQQPITRHGELADVWAFQQKFNVPMASVPSFLDRETFDFRLKFLQEELHEFFVAHTSRDMHGAADALVDLAYVLYGTALMMGLGDAWPQLWAEVQRANMSKVRAAHAGESKRESTLDVVKPAGWKPPDHSAALGAGLWHVFDATTAAYITSTERPVCLKHCTGGGPCYCPESAAAQKTED